SAKMILLISILFHAGANAPLYGPMSPPLAVFPTVYSDPLAPPTLPLMFLQPPQTLLPGVQTFFSAPPHVLTTEYYDYTLPPGCVPGDNPRHPHAIRCRYRYPVDDDDDNSLLRNYLALR